MEMSATAKAFSIVELLEAVLYALPTRDLLLVERISKAWRAVIKNSIKLQQALFFQTLPGGPLTLTEAKAAYGKVFKNPLLTLLFRELGYIEAVTRAVSVVEKLPTLGRRYDAWCYPKASWKKMLPTQPATRYLFSVNVFIEDLDEGDEEDKNKTCSRRAIRMGKIVDDIDKIIKELWEENGQTSVEMDNLWECKALKRNSQLESMVRRMKHRKEQGVWPDEVSSDEEEVESESDAYSSDEEESESESDGGSSDGEDSALESNEGYSDDENSESELDTSARGNDESESEQDTTSSEEEESG